PCGSQHFKCRVSTNSTTRAWRPVYPRWRRQITKSSSEQSAPLRWLPTLNGACDAVDVGGQLALPDPAAGRDGSRLRHGGSPQSSSGDGGGAVCLTALPDPSLGGGTLRSPGSGPG